MELMRKKYENLSDDEDMPLFYADIYLELNGPPTRGRCQGTPPQLICPNQFQPSQSSEWELQLKEERRKERECAESQEKEIRMLHTRFTKQEVLIQRQEDQLRQANLSISTI